MLGVRIAAPIPTASSTLLLAAPSAGGLPALCAADADREDFENEDKLTAEGYRKQLETNYSQNCRRAGDAFIDARFNIKRSPSIRAGCALFVNSAQLIYREPVAHEIPLLTLPTLFVMGADDHNAPGRPNAPEALRPKMGENAALAQAFAAKMANARAEVIPDTGHLVFLEARQKFDELMLAFLGRR